MFEGDSTLVRLTEGELKADVATACTGILTMSIAGVSCWRPALLVLNELNVSTARLAFDADARDKRPVARALQQTATALAAAGHHLEGEDGDEAHGNEIDDLPAAGRFPRLQRGDDVHTWITDIVAAAEQADPPASETLLLKARQLVDTLDSMTPEQICLPETIGLLATLYEKDRARYGLLKPNLKRKFGGTRDIEAAVKAEVDRRSRELHSPPDEASENSPTNPDPFERWSDPLDANYLVKHGRFFRRKFVHEKPSNVPLCNFVAQMVADVTQDNGAEMHRRFAVEGRLHTGAILKPPRRRRH